jgi:hypothetical protein
MSVEWLAGLVDGEGCFSIHVAERNHHGHHLSYQGRFIISMKSGHWSESAAKILRTSGVLFHQTVRNEQTSIAAVEGWKQTQKLGKLLVQHLIVKRTLVDRLLEYEPASNNRFPSRKVVQCRPKLLDFVRDFNKGKNRRYKWTGSMIMRFYECD